MATVTKTAVLDKLRRIKGPDLTGNIVDLGLVSEVLIKEARVYFSITVPAARARDLEPLRQAAEKLVGEVDGVSGVTCVLTAEAEARGSSSGTGAASAAERPAPAAISGGEHARVREARETGRAGNGGRSDAHGHSHGPGNGHGHDHQHAPRPATAGPAPAAARSNAVPGVKHLVAVASGKGGVGKSTTAVNLALGLQSLGLKVGVLDADIYGPSQPRLLGLSGRPEVVAGGKTLKPMRGYGLKAMSMGFMVDEATPIVWRGPMIVQALNQMLRDVAWDEGDGGLDILVIDMPPGTGDVQLTMAQQVPLSGAVIVSTPQDLALIDARKGLNMFRQVRVPVLGIIENMSYFCCPKCGERSDIFGHGGAEVEAKALNLPFLGGIPLSIEVRARSDSGQPITATLPESHHAEIYRDIAAKVWAAIGAEDGASVPAPILTIDPAGDGMTAEFADGTTYKLSAEYLRVMSPSAEVQGHSPEQRVTVPKKRAVKIRDLRQVGNYAVRIAFDDGHDTGLYTWPYIAELGRDHTKRWAGYLGELEAKGLSRG